MKTETEPTPEAMAQAEELARRHSIECASRVSRPILGSIGGPPVPSGFACTCSRDAEVRDFALLIDAKNREIAEARREGAREAITFAAENIERGMPYGRSDLGGWLLEWWFERNPLPGGEGDERGE